MQPIFLCREIHRRPQTALQHKQHMCTPLFSPNNRNLIQLKKKSTCSFTKRVSRKYIKKYFKAFLLLEKVLDYFLKR